MQHICYKQQSGLVMIILLTIIMVGGLAWLLQGLNRNHYDIARQNQTIEALAEAKEALIAFAVTYSDHENKAGFYGFLPCPDANGNLSSEGAQDPSCGGKEQNSLGRLPWRTLGIAPLRDGAGECLWYAVAGPYKNSPRTDLLNEDRAGRFTLSEANGSTSPSRMFGSSSNPERAVALIIAPNAVLSTSTHPQDRAPDGNAPVCGGNYESVNYLDADTYLMREQTPWVGSDINNAELGDTNKAGIESAIISNPRTSSVNDVMMTITRAEIFDVVRRRVEFQQNLHCLTQIAAQCLAQYGRDNGRLPWTGAVDLDDYTDDADYADIDANTANLGRLPNTLTNSNATLSASSADFLLSNGSDWLCDLSSFDSTTLSQCTSPSTLDPNELATCDGQTGTTACQNEQNATVTAARRLWEHWKDHLFYAVSSSFEPDSSLADCSGSCVEVNGSKYAGIVLLAGRRTVEQQQRDIDMLPDVVAPLELEQYLDIDKSIGIDNTNDDNAYTHLADGVRTAYDDFIVCIGADLTAESVVPCP